MYMSNYFPACLSLPQTFQPFDKQCISGNIAVWKMMKTPSWISVLWASFQKAVTMGLV